MPFNFPDSMEQATIEAMDDPQVGDRFAEMYSFWVYVVYRDEDCVVTMEGSPPTTFPDEGELRVYSVEEMKERFGYKGGGDYWVRLVDRGNNVVGWYEKAPDLGLQERRKKVLEDHKDEGYTDEQQSVEGPIDISRIKRCYAGVIITIKCPVCERQLEHNLGSDYLSYPEVGGDDTAYFYCDPCEAEMEMPIKIKSANIVIEYNPKDVVIDE